MGPMGLIRFRSPIDPISAIHIVLQLLFATGKPIEKSIGVFYGIEFATFDDAEGSVIE
jgi:hypothetical protein